MRVRNIALVTAAAIMVSGCAAPIIGTLTLSQLTTIAGLASTATTGKGLFDHALSAVTGKDCNITEGILRKDRKICEEENSLATKDDFKGVFAWLDKHDAKQPNDTPTGDVVLAGYEKARGEELAQANDTPAPGEPVADVVPASAAALDLRLAQNDAPAVAPVAAPGGAPVIASAPVSPGSPQATWLTFRDDEADGTPRIVSRYVYMQPVSASGDATADASASASTAPVTTASLAVPPPTPAPAPVAAPAPVVAAAPPPAPAPAVAVAAPAPLAKPAPVAAAATPPTPAKPVVVATNSVPAAAPARAKPAAKADAPPASILPKVYWYLSGR